MKRALITGISGQDGAYLSQLLLNKGYEVYGTSRKKSESRQEKLGLLGIEDKVNLLPMSLHEFTNIHRVIEKSRPDEIYHLGAQSFVGLSFEEPLYTADITALGTLRILETIRTFNPKIKFYQASSSEMYGKAMSIPQKEDTRFHPRSPYAISKLFAHWSTVNFRESFGMFTCSGILFNHESPLRGSEFVTRKITSSVARIKQGLQDQILLGNLEARRDWGFAPEYVEAMWLMLQQPDPDDYIIATGKSHSIRDFVEIAFSIVGINIEWTGEGINQEGRDSKSGKILVSVNPDFFRPAEVNNTVGDYTKAREKLGWTPKTSFEELVRIMVEHDLKHVEANYPF
jgi:GDPmannose 4,6-dehydratase